MVRLGVPTAYTSDDYGPRFNSSMVRLGVNFFKILYGRLSRFNSSMVRLGVEGYWVYDTHPTEFQFQYGAIRRTCTLKFTLVDGQFQFQYGAIRSIPLLRIPFINSVFQFQYGAIRSKTLVKGQPEYLCFNSSMVRLGADKKLLSLFREVVSIPVWCD